MGRAILSPLHKREKSAYLTRDIILMKVESITIKDFKRFERLEVLFKNQTLDTVSNRFLLLGDNGTGKTTLLQAIALPLALATKQIRRVTDFDWLGFLPGRYQRWGAPYIEIEVLFTTEELYIYD